MTVMDSHTGWPLPVRDLIQTTLKRINKEIADLQKEDVGDILLYPQEDNIHRWTGWIPGPDDGPYQGGQFELKIDLPTDYP